MTEITSTKNYRSNAIVVGILFIIATAFLFIGGAIYNPVIEAPNYLELAYPKRITVVIGILVEFACIISIPLIPVFVYPVLKQYNQPLTLGYVVFRLFEAVFFVLTEVCTLTLISISQGYLVADSADAAIFENMGNAMQSGMVWMFSIYVLIFAVGSMIFNTVLYKSKLVPRLISGFGVMAAILIFAGTILVLLEIATEDVAMVFYLPIAVQEMIFAVWVIVKGFNLSEQPG